MFEVPEVETTDLARERARHASNGALTLQACNDCGLVQYPSRSVCANCLSAALSWSEVPATGQVIATAVVHASLHKEFREHGMWRICSVVLGVGPRVLAFTADDGIQPGATVAIHDQKYGEQRCLLVARRPEPAGEEHS